MSTSKTISQDKANVLPNWNKVLALSDGLPRDCLAAKYEQELRYNFSKVI